MREKEKMLLMYIKQNLHYKLKVYAVKHKTTMKKVIERLISELPIEEDKKND